MNRIVGGASPTTAFVRRLGYCVNHDSTTGWLLVSPRVLLPLPRRSATAQCVSHQGDARKLSLVLVLASSARSVVLTVQVATSRELDCWGRTGLNMDLGMRARVRAGDPEAFGELFDGFARAVYNHAFRLTADWSVAEEVVALTFLEAWRLRSKVEPEGGSLHPWLLGIATNVVRNTVRAKRRHAAWMARLPPPVEEPDFADELVERLDRGAHVAAVRDAIAGLRSQEQEVLALCVWGGLDYAAAAEVLAVPVGTVRSRLSRARKKIQKLLGDVPLDGWELATRHGQLNSDRENAVRPSQEVIP